MKEIFVIHEGGEIITARDTMNNAIAAAMNRLTFCGCLCEEFEYHEDITFITYRTSKHETHIMLIEATKFKEGI